MNINISNIIKGTYVNGPGRRYGLWTQFCPHACKGCFNPETWARGGTPLSTLQIADDILNSDCTGLTISGGDPLSQPESLLELLQTLHNNGECLLSDGIIVFTGYTIEEIQSNDPMKACLPYIDLVIEGRFVEALKHNHSLSGSSNQRFIWNDLPGRGKDIMDADAIENSYGHQVEIHSNNDLIQVTGFPTVDQKWLKSQGLTLISKPLLKP